MWTSWPWVRTPDTSVFPVDVVDVAVVLEEIVVLDLQDVQNAFDTLFGLLYALYIDYPKELRYTFEVIHQNLYEGW